MGAWLQFVYASKRTFSSNILLLEFSFPSNFSFSNPPTGTQTMCRWTESWMELKLTNQTQKQFDQWANWKEATGMERKLKVDQSIVSTNHTHRQIWSSQAVNIPFCTAQEEATLSPPYLSLKGVSLTCFHSLSWLLSCFWAAVCFPEYYLVWPLTVVRDLRLLLVITQCTWKRKQAWVQVTIARTRLKEGIW